MDKFLSWLKNNEGDIALVDKSYKKTYEREKGEPFKGEVNFSLATYGDAVLKLALCEILWKEYNEKLTEEKKKYESDKVLVTVIAKHYDILEYLKYDKDDNKKRNDYDWETKDKNKYKFIATAVEACLGAIYKEKNDINYIVEIVKEWKNMVDKSENR